MTPERWQRLKVLFEAASRLSAEDWEEFIAAACPGDQELAASLRSLLEQTTSSGSLLDHPLVSLSQQSAPTPLPQTFQRGQLVDNRFEIVSFLGKGGMGEVYRAFDKELQDQVALKTIRSDTADPSGMLQRLRQEVRRSRRIAHPNVCRVYDLFTHSLGGDSPAAFLTMQLLTGPTLAEVLRTHGPMQVSQAARLAKQMLAALAAAHEAGIIHRDFKPGNIMLVDFEGSNCQAVVTDFGLAVERTLLSGVSSDSRSLTIAGTPDYMAPERFRGLSTTASDIYSFGVVLFEMLAGVTPNAVTSELSGDPAAGLTQPALNRIRDLPGHLRNVIVRCLEMKPQDRFRSAVEVLTALDSPTGSIAAQLRPGFTRRAYLTGLSAAAAAALLAALVKWSRPHLITVPASLIVLPFQEIGTSPDGTLLADGLTDGLIDALSQRKLLRVIAHGSTFHYKGRTRDARTLNRELNVAWVLSGAIETRNGRVSIAASLSTAPKGERIWTKQFAGTVSSILALQRRIAQDVTVVLKASAESEEPSIGQDLSPNDLEAYKLYLKGRFQWNLRNEAGLRQAIDYFREAIGMDPNDERAYCGLADSYALLGIFALAAPKEVMPEAKMAARQALALHDELSAAYASLGLIQAVFDWDWPRAGESFRRAVELDPSYVTGHHWYAFYLAWTSQPQLAREHMLQALSLDPLSVVIPAGLGWLAFWNRDYRRAEAHFRHTLALNPNYTGAYAPLALTCAQQSRFAEALGIIEAGRKLNPASNTLPDLARIYALAGQHADAVRTIADAEEAFSNRYTPGTTMAMAYAALLDTDKAFDWLEKAYQERSSEMSFLKVDPRFDSLRKDPRFDDLLRKAHFLS